MRRVCVLTAGSFGPVVIAKSDKLISTMSAKLIVKSESGFQMPDGNVKFYDACAGYYDVLHSNREEEFQFYRSFLPPALNVLEIACGSGTLSRVLAETAASVTGIDASEPMLDLARKRLPEGRFVQADMRAFDLGKCFDVVVCPFNSLMHLTPSDALSALSAFAAHCADDGQVVIDVANVDDSFLAPSSPETVIRTFLDEMSGRSMRAWERSEYEQESRTLSVHWRIEDMQSGETTAASSYTQQIFTAGELDGMIAEAGLHVLQRFGTYDLKPFAAGWPRHLIAAAPRS